MKTFRTQYGRRSFLKNSALAGGGMMLGFSWLASCTRSEEEMLAMPDEWFEINGYIKIGNNGVVTIQSPNPEIGQNVKTSMPMIVAEELDVDWKKVMVEQAPLNTAIFTRQLAGGSQSIRQGWQSLRMAGATARQLLLQAAAQTWGVGVESLTTEAGMIIHEASGQQAGYGEMAALAATLEVQEEVALKDHKDFKIIGTSRKNVDGQKIVTGQPLCGLDIQKEGMQIAMIIHAPAFGQKLKSYDATRAKAMPGITDVFTIQTYAEDYNRQWSDVDAFNEMIVVVGQTTWEVMKAKQAVQVEWETVAPLESTEEHYKNMAAMAAKPGRTLRKDGNPEGAFAQAEKVIERTYTAPFLAHNTMEPMNFYADVTEEKAELIGPIQTPEFMEKSVAARLGLPLEKIDIQMTRMGGGFGRRLYGHFVVEAAVISQQVGTPVKLVYTREDDMTFGTYRPAYHVTYRAGLDKDNNLIAFHVKAGGIPESPVAANRFPAGAVDNYLAEDWSIPSAVSVGAFRAPRSNFIAGAEQSFLDEVAELAGKDPIAFRLELLNRAKENPVGERNDYDAARYAGVLELVRDKSGWGQGDESANRGVSAYFCHNSYVAQVMDVRVDGGQTIVDKVHCAIDCGIVVNPDAAVNLAQGGVVDGIGHALYSEIRIKEGASEANNFNRYKLIRHSEAPKDIQVHFVDNGLDPTGLGEPLNPPIVGALANAMYKATGTRMYHQPFLGEQKILG
jgi:isoquinoline 1-oxidoreductase beta subunit